MLEVIERVYPIYQLDWAGIRYLAVVAATAAAGLVIGLWNRSVNGLEEIWKKVEVRTQDIIRDSRPECLHCSRARIRRVIWRLLLLLLLLSGSKEEQTMNRVLSQRRQDVYRSNVVRPSRNRIHLRR